MNYHSFFGIDIGKNEFVVAELLSKKVEAFSNDPNGWSACFRAKYSFLKDALVVLETTGGYEHGLLTFLIEQGITVHRADTRKVKNFIRSFGQKAKTDKIDAQALAVYGSERFAKLEPYKAVDSVQESLKLLEERRQDLKQMLVKEKNRAKAPLSGPILKSIQGVISFLEKEVTNLSDEIDVLITNSPILKDKQKTLLEIPGIGEITSKSLVALLPELGHLDRRKITSLCGLAPHAKQSGTKIWYSRTSGGRRNLRPVLFMAAMAARRSKTPLGDFYEKLVANGKKKMVALVALMRKIIVIANAKWRDKMAANEENQTTIN